MGDVILISKRLRLDWVDAIAFDLRVSRAGLRVACIIGKHFNSSSGLTFMRLDTIAKDAGISERTAWTAVRELEARGYLAVTRTEHAVKDGRGRKVFGGRGRANVYRPAFNHELISATDPGKKLAAHCELLASKASNPLRASKRESSQNRVTKLAAHCEPTLTSLSEKYPVVWTRLVELVGAEQAEAWLRNLSADGVTDGIVTVTAPTKFMREAIEKQFTDALLQAWREQDASVTAVRVDQRGARREARRA